MACVRRRQRWKWIKTANFEIMNCGAICGSGQSETRNYILNGGLWFSVINGKEVVSNPHM